MNGFQEVSGGNGRPQELLHDQLHVQHEKGKNNNKVLALWGASKDDLRRVIVNKAVVFPGDGEDYDMNPEDRHVGADTSSSAATISMPPVEDDDGNQWIEDGHRVTVEDHGGNATNNNITVDTPDDASIETSTISTNDVKVDYMYDAANDNWKDVS